MTTYHLRQRPSNRESQSVRVSTFAMSRHTMTTHSEALPQRAIQRTTCGAAAVALLHQRCEPHGYRPQFVEVGDFGPECQQAIYRIGVLKMDGILQRRVTRAVRLINNGRQQMAQLGSSIQEVLSTTHSSSVGVTPRLSLTSTTAPAPTSTRRHSTEREYRCPCSCPPNQPSLPPPPAGECIPRFQPPRRSAPE